LLKPFTLTVFLLLPALAQGADLFGEVKEFKGDVRSNGTPVFEGSKVFIHERLTTGPKSFVRLLLPEGVAMQIGPQSSIELKRDKDKVTSLQLIKGFVLSRIRAAVAQAEKDKFRVHSKTVSMGVRGTTFFAKAEKKKTFLCTCEGTVHVKWPKGEETITSKHHDSPKFISEDSGQTDPAPMGADHADEDAVALDKLLNGN
jgi:hypothetical protein